MKNNVFLAFAFGAIAVVGAVVLAAMGKNVPPELWTLAGVAVGGGAGIAVPTLASGAVAALTATAQSAAATTPTAGTGAVPAVAAPVHTDVVVPAVPASPDATSRTV